MSELKIRAITYFFTLFIVFIGGFIGYERGGVSLLVPLEISLLLAISLLQPLLRPKYGKLKTRLALISLYGLIVITIVRGETWIILLLNWFFGGTDLFTIQTPERLERIITLLIPSVVLIFLTWFFEKQQILSPVLATPRDEESLFQEPDYKILRDRFCKFMVTSYLDTLDEETNWSDSDYSTLEAEIEMTHQGGKSPRIVADLVKAIRNDKKSTPFILIGESGSGKSVSLRRLARELYKEVSNQGIHAVVPIYINLKEWDRSQNLTDRDIHKFSYQYLKNISGRVAKKFINIYYEKLLSNGLLFFIFDSFDEMPMVLDCDDRSDHLKQVSLAFDTFFKDLHQCRGILASRPFRQPIGLQGRRLLIRPFGENQIRDAMKNWLLGKGLDSEEIVRRLLVEKAHLASALRNPFMSELIAQYIIDYRESLPDTYYDLFDHYINKRFSEDNSKIEELGLNKTDVLRMSTEIAQAIYNTPGIGLEINISTLREKIADPKLEDKIKAMQYSRIVRWGGSSKKSFSFVHRKFAEFFAVKKLLENPDMINKNAIPTDSRWRDGLVVYCGIAPEEEVRQLANFAWQTIQKNTSELITGNAREAQSAIHCLRFLRDACQSRPETILIFQEELSSLILELLDGTDILVAKIAAESLPLLTPDARMHGIKIAFSRENWVSETALRACRNLAKLEYQSVIAVCLYTQTIPTFLLLKSFSELDFSLSLSDSLQQVRRIHRADVVSLLLLWVVSTYFAVLLMTDLPHLSASQRILNIYTSTVLIIIIEYMTLSKNMDKILIFPQLFENFTLKKYGYIDKILPKKLAIHQIYRKGFDSSIRLFWILFLSLSFLMLKYPLSADYISKFIDSVVSKLIINSSKIYFDISDIFDLFNIFSIFNRSYVVGIYLLITFIVIPGSFYAGIIDLLLKQNSSLTWIYLKDKLKLPKIHKLLVLFLVTLCLAYAGLLIIPWIIFILISFQNEISIILAIYVAIASGFLVVSGFKYMREILQDLRLISQLDFEGEITWKAIYQITEKIKSNWGKTRYLRMLRIQKIQIKESSGFPHGRLLLGSSAQIEMAKLMEQVYDLQE